MRMLVRLVMVLDWTETSVSRRRLRFSIEFYSITAERRTHIYLFTFWWYDEE